MNGIDLFSEKYPNAQNGEEVEHGIHKTRTAGKCFKCSTVCSFANRNLKCRVCGTKCNLLLIDDWVHRELKRYRNGDDL